MAREQALRAVNTYALKWRGAMKAGKLAMPRCGEKAPVCPETWQAKSSCALRAYHTGLHRSKRYMWGNGDRSVRLKRGRAPNTKTCLKNPGYCRVCRRRHYARRPSI